MKTVSKIALIAATFGVLAIAPTAQAGWRKRVVVVTPMQTVYATPAVESTSWTTSSGDVIQSSYNMIPADPIGTSLPPLPVVTGYEVVTPRRVKVVTPRKVVYYRYN